MPYEKLPCGSHKYFLLGDQGVHVFGYPSGRVGIETEAGLAGTPEDPAMGIRYLEGYYNPVDDMLEV